MTRYEPRYGERRCCVCGRWRGEHLGPSLGANHDLVCPVVAETREYFETTPTFVPMSGVERYHMTQEEHTARRSWLSIAVGPRWREVETYASQRNITLGEAVVELVNRGLSHTGDLHVQSDY